MLKHIFIETDLEVNEVIEERGIEKEEKKEMKEIEERNDDQKNEIV